MIGFYLDLTTESGGKIGFTKNGVDLGVAFSNARRSFLGIGSIPIL